MAPVQLCFDCGSPDASLAHTRLRGLPATSAYRRFDIHAVMERAA